MNKPTAKKLMDNFLQYWQNDGLNTISYDVMKSTDEVIFQKLTNSLLYCPTLTGKEMASNLRAK